MKLAEVRRNAFAMPLNDPAYPPGPYKFYNREFVVITGSECGEVWILTSVRRNGQI